MIFEVFSGSCGSLNFIECFDESILDEAIVLDNLNQGLTYYIRVASYLGLIVNTSFDINLNPHDHIVCTEFDTGNNTFRDAVSDAVSGDTVYFAYNLIDIPIQLQTPTITIDKNLVFHSRFLDNIIFTNVNPNNNKQLLSIEQDLDVRNLQLQGTSSDAMKIEIKNGGKIKVY